jgi:hypothetical protein
MSPLQKVLYTAKIHTTGGWDGAARSLRRDKPDQPDGGREVGWEGISMEVAVSRGPAGTSGPSLVQRRPWEHFLCGH